MLISILDDIVLRPAPESGRVCCIFSPQVVKDKDPVSPCIPSSPRNLRTPRECTLGASPPSCHFCVNFSPLHHLCLVAPAWDCPPEVSLFALGLLMFRKGSQTSYNQLLISYWISYCCQSEHDILSSRDSDYKPSKHTNFFPLVLLPGVGKWESTAK